MSTNARIAVVTGANKGIGFAIVRNLALQYSSSALNTGPFLIYLTARDASRGQAALAALNGDEQILKAKVLKAQGGAVNLAFHCLDISDKASVDAFVEMLKQTHGEIDIIVNNAGIAPDGFNYDITTQTLHTNYHSTVYTTLACLPIMRPGPLSRIVNVASLVGRLGWFPPVLQQLFRSATLEDATNLMRQFEEGVKRGNHEQLGFPSNAYAVSKAGLIAATRAIARENDNRGVLINACCPGHVNTDMTEGQGTKTPDQGAETPVLLAIHDIGGKSGEMWSEEVIYEW